ncbi:hypothetical protein CEE96_11660, partial [Lactobacillus crispatus]
TVGQDDVRSTAGSQRNQQLIGKSGSPELDDQFIVGLRRIERLDQVLVQGGLLRRGRAFLPPHHAFGRGLCLCGRETGHRRGRSRQNGSPGDIRNGHHASISRTQLNPRPLKSEAALEGLHLGLRLQTCDLGEAGGQFDLRAVRIVGQQLNERTVVGR